MSGELLMSRVKKKEKKKSKLIRVIFPPYKNFLRVSPSSERRGFALTNKIALKGPEHQLRDLSAVKIGSLSIRLISKFWFYISTSLETHTFIRRNN